MRKILSLERKARKQGFMTVRENNRFRELAGCSDHPSEQLPLVLSADVPPISPISSALWTPGALPVPNS